MIYYNPKRSILGTTTALAAFWILQSNVVVSAAVFREYTFEVEPKVGDAYSPDCQNVKEQRRWLNLVTDVDTEAATAMMPGPLIEADEGDTIRLTVTNKHQSDEVTLHYHGLHQVDNPWSDGPSLITQCGLPPGQTQTYEFLAYPPGTHYWHAHLALALADGTL
jgi:FtsP/CotA-like multicopper oxidase with cupredoxin domain